jgi:hypothetical protein
MISISKEDLRTVVHEALVAIFGDRNSVEQIIFSTNLITYGIASKALIPDPDEVKNTDSKQCCLTCGHSIFEHTVGRCVHFTIAINHARDSICGCTGFISQKDSALVDIFEIYRRIVAAVWDIAQKNKHESISTDWVDQIINNVLKEYYASYK